MKPTVVIRDLGTILSDSSENIKNRRNLRRRKKHGRRSSRIQANGTVKCKGMRVSSDVTVKKDTYFNVTVLH